jgi:hypothetical protein
MQREDGFELIITDEDELNVIEEALLAYDPYDDDAFTLLEKNKMYDTAKIVLRRLGHKL